MPPTDPATLLREAEAHLSHAREHLATTRRDDAAALDAVLGSFRASLRALLRGYGASPAPDAPLDVLAARAVRNDSTLKTAVNRAVRLAERAPAIRQASSRPSVHDREDVETGAYTARNLLQTVTGRLATQPAGT